MAKVGAPTKYKDDYARQAEIVCAESGFSDAKLANLFGVSVSTLNSWKHEHPEFLESIRRGKDTWDTSTAEHCLFKRVCGYEFKEVTKEINPATGKMRITKIVKKEIPGDVKAQTFWLRNRNRERWPDTHNVDGNLGIKISHEEMLDKLE